MLPPEPVVVGIEVVPAPVASCALATLASERLKANAATLFDLRIIIMCFAPSKFQITDLRLSIACG